ncbi:hypothetical protein B0H17DRAFT_1330580 [Mycena rosella]|uniref:Uncharacterized protein n=1 Tax=Mycena rosella TaxID=1033263 RepID=A0AAD7DJ80_MYCRO|nr:hypothetical protein B0H17DRAFT_1330580 [Mycena rosella]
MSSGAFWKYFDNSGKKQNQSHYHSYCLGCLDHQKRLLQDAGTFNQAEWIQMRELPKPRRLQIRIPTPRLTNPFILFGDVVKKPVTKFTEADIDHEAELMETLAEAEEDARPDDGGIECSDDEYQPWN